MGLIDPSAKLILPPKYDEIDSIDFGHVMVRFHGQLTYFDPKFLPIQKKWIALGH